MPAEHPYHDKSYSKLEKELSRLSTDGASAAAIAARIRAVFTEKNRAIRNVAFRKLDPSSVADDYLLPRKDLFRFAAESWIRFIFLPSLPRPAADSILMFGLGRLFSAYNDLGVQHSTDVDFNIIALDSLPQKDFAAVNRALASLKAALHDEFGIVLELNPDYSLLRESTVAKRLEAGKPAERMACALFYKANERSLRILHDREDIRERIFSRVRDLPDAFLFEHFLGLRGGKATFAKLRDGSPLEIGQDSLGPAARIRTLIGSRSYDLYCRRTFPRRLFISPPEWHFSMKYFVNRVYDYVCAMRGLGYSLADIGFGSKASGGADPDWLYLRNAHKLMLYLQEVCQNTLGAYSAGIDTSYLSRARYMRFVEVAGDRFRADFDGMVMDGGLLPPSRVLRYKALQAKIKARARDRFMEGPLEELKCFPPGFCYESTHKDANGYRIFVPYSWADQAYFALNAIAERMALIVEGRLLPALVGLGMPAGDMKLYAEALKPQAPAGDA